MQLLLAWRAREGTLEAPCGPSQHLERSTLGLLVYDVRDQIMSFVVATPAGVAMAQTCKLWLMQERTCSGYEDRLAAVAPAMHALVKYYNSDCRAPAGHRIEWRAYWVWLMRPSLPNSKHTSVLLSKHAFAVKRRRRNLFLLLRLLWRTAAGSLTGLLSLQPLADLNVLIIGKHFAIEPGRLGLLANSEDVRGSPLFMAVCSTVCYSRTLKFISVASTHARVASRQFSHFAALIVVMDDFSGPSAVKELINQLQELPQCAAAKLLLKGSDCAWRRHAQQVVSASPGDATMPSASTYSNVSLSMMEVVVKLELPRSCRFRDWCTMASSDMHLNKKVDWSAIRWLVNLEEAESILAGSEAS